MAVYSTKTNRNKSRNNMLKLGWSLISIFSVLLLVVVFNLLNIFSIVILGTFGLLFYPLCIFFIFFGIMLIANRNVKVSKNIVIFSFLWLFVFVLIMQMLTSKNIDEGFSRYIATTFKEHLTAGGVVFGTILYPLFYLTHDVATYIILLCVLVVFSAILIDKIRVLIVAKNTFEVHDSNIEEKTLTNDINDELDDSLALESNYQPIDHNELIDDEVFIADEDDEPSSKNEAKIILGMTNERTIDALQKVAEKSNIDDEELTNVTLNSVNHIEQNTKRPSIIVHEDDFSLNINKLSNEPRVDIVEQNKNDEDLRKEERKKAALEFLQISSGKFQTSKELAKGIDNVKEERTNVPQNPNTTTNSSPYFANSVKTQSTSLSSVGSLNSNIVSNNNSNNRPENYNPNKPLGALENGFTKQSHLYSTTTEQDLYDEQLTKSSFEQNRENGTQSIKIPSYLQSQTKFVPEKAKMVYTGEVNKNIVSPEKNQNRQISIDDPIIRKPKEVRIPKPYKRPPIDLLNKHDSQVNIDESYLQSNAENIVRTLKSFKIDTEVLDIIQGPTFTSYELKMKEGVSVSTIFNKENDLKMVLRSNKIRLQVPIPGKNAFGIEVPNVKRSMVGLRDILESPEFQNSSSPLTVALGKDITNTCKVHQIDKMVHTLVAGGTNSGKSVCLHTLLISLLYKASPDELKLLLVDPKRVEFGFYNDLPHMLIPKAINDVDKAVNALEWLVKEMERRYTKLQSILARNIIMYNNSPEVKSGQLEKMYYIVMVFDEVGDFMIQRKKDIEDNIKRLAAMARACGIHLILTTQKPTQEVITGTIKTNLPSRIAFAVTSNIDSRVILDSVGAETLLGKGDMLFLPQGASDPERMQCAFVDDDVELRRVLDYIKDNNEAIFDETIEDEMFNKKEGFDPTNGVDDVTDPLVKDCMKLFIKKKKASAGSIQSFFSVGWPRASKIMAQLEKLSYVSPSDSKNNRTILMTEQEFEEVFGESIDD